MKKAFAVALLTIHLFLLCTSSAFAEDDIISFVCEPKLLSTLETSASEWYDSEEMRALFCATAAMDIVLMENEEYTNIVTSALLTGCSYMAKNGFTLSAYFFGEEQVLLFVYTPLTGECEGAILDMPMASIASFVMSELKTSGDISSYYEVENSEILTMMRLALEALE